MTQSISKRGIKKNLMTQSLSKVDVENVMTQSISRVDVENVMTQSI